MKKTKEIGEKILKYAEERLQEHSFSTEKIRKYVRELGEVSKELIYSSTLMAGHKKISIDQSSEL